MALTIEELQILITAETDTLKRELTAIKRQFSGMDDGLKVATRKINKDLEDTKRSFKEFGIEIGRSANMLRTAVVAVAGAVGALGLNDALQDAIKYESAIGTLNLQLGEAADSFFAWGDANREALGMSRSVFANFASQYATMERNFASSKAQLATFTEDLLKVSTIIQSRTGRSLQDVSERILSGLRGETDAIEDLGIQISVAMIESTKAFKDFANGRSWDQIDFKTQGLIRHFAILEQASALYGTQLVDNTATRQAQFIAQLENMRLSLGQAIQPIYSAVLPALTEFAKSIAEVLAWVAGLTQALFGTKNATDAVTTAASNASKAYDAAGNAAVTSGKDAEKATKAAKGALATFDEINQFNLTQSGDGGAGGAVGGAAGVPKLDEITGSKDADGVGDKFEKLAEQIREAFDRIVPPELRQRVTDAWASIDKAFGDLKNTILDLADNPVVKWVTEQLADRILTSYAGFALTMAGIIEQVSGALKLFDGITTGDLEKSIGGLEQMVSGAYDQVNGFVYLINGDWGDAMKEFKGRFSEAWQEMKADIKAYGDPTKLELSDFFKYARDKAKEGWGWVQETTYTTWQNIQMGLGEQLSSLREGAGIALDGVRSWIGQKWEDMKTDALIKWTAIRLTAKTIWDSFLTFIHWDSIKEKLAESWTSIQTTAQNTLETIRTWMGKKWEEIGKTVDNAKAGFNGIVNYIRTDFTNDWNAVWGNLGNKFSDLLSPIGGAIKNVMNTVIDYVNRAIRSLNTLQVNVPKALQDVFGESIGFNIPEIPKLARGGITNVNDPFLAMVGDNRTQREVVAPLDDLMGMIASAVGTAVAAANTIGNSGSNGGTTPPIILQIGGTEIARVLIPFFDSERSRQGVTSVMTVG